MGVRCNSYGRILKMIKEYFHLIGILTLLLWAVVQKSARGITSVGVEPIVGYERVQMLVPTPHIKDRLVYGLRSIYEFTVLSAEAKYQATAGFVVQFP